MKTHPSRRKDGFTLVELLVVIAIIAVLAGAGFAAGNAAIQKAKKSTALATCTSIESAVNNFFTEYGTMPKESITEAPLVTRKGGTGIETINVLLGASDAVSTRLNPRGVKFLSVKEGKANRNGLIYTTGANPTAEAIFDPWGGPFYIALDHDFDEVVVASASAKNTNLNGRRCAVWSQGVDGVKGSGGTAADDVITW